MTCSSRHRKLLFRLRFKTLEICMRLFLDGRVQQALRFVRKIVKFKQEHVIGAQLFMLRA